MKINNIMKIKYIILLSYFNNRLSQEEGTAFLVSLANKEKKCLPITLNASESLTQSRS